MTLVAELLGSPETALDWVRVAAAFLAGVTAGMTFVVIRAYASLYGIQGTVRQLHVVLISTSYLILTAALTYAEIGLIGQPATRISWVVALASIVAFPIGLWALWIILRHASTRMSETADTVDE